MVWSITMDIELMLKGFPAHPCCLLGPGGAIKDVSLCLAGASWTLWWRHVKHRRACKAALLRAVRHVSDAEAVRSRADAFQRWAALSRIRAHTEARGAALAARRAARTVQDAFAGWAAYASAMSDASAVRADLLAVRDSEVRSHGVGLRGCCACAHACEAPRISADAALQMY